MARAQNWGQLTVVAVAALLCVITLDWALHATAPPRRLREAQDGIEDLRRSNPDVLVLGSSHARTFHVLGQELARRTHDRQTVVSVPLENGKIVAYRWLLTHKLQPLIDERDTAGHRVRDRLARMILLTEWWDTCPREAGAPDWNIPARAWTAGDFAADVWAHGLNGFNRNYLQNKFRTLIPASALIYDRFQTELLIRLARLAHGKPVTRPASEEQAKTAAWQTMIEKGEQCIWNPAQVQALNDIVEFARARQLDMTIVLFPRKPGTLTDTAKRTTLSRFAQDVRELAEPQGVRVIDLTWTTPLQDADFMEDFDHVNAAGNLKFAAWALDHDLGFLTSTPAMAAGR